MGRARAAAAFCWEAPRARRFCRSSPLPPRAPGPRPPTQKDQRFCPAHSSDATPQCCACARLEPRGAEWPALQDGGRRLCLDCLGSVVVDTRDAQPLYREVLAFFAAQGMGHAYAPPLLLVEGGVLEGARAGGGGGACAGACRQPLPARSVFAPSPLPPAPTPPPRAPARADHASRETGRARGEQGPVFHVRGLCVATVYT